LLDVKDENGRNIPEMYSIVLRSRQLEEAGFSHPRDVYDILEKFLEEGSIYSLDITHAPKVVTSLELIRKHRVGPRKPHFDKETGKLHYDGKNIEFTIGSAAYAVCEILFNPKRKGIKVRAFDVKAQIDHYAGKDQGERSAYYGMREVNLRTKKVFKLKKNLLKQSKEELGAMMMWVNL